MITGKWVKGKETGFSELFELRRQVFCLEQGVDEADELDEFDRIASHAVVCDDGELVATGRVYPDEVGFCLGRICVKKSRRGEGFGDVVLKMLVNKAVSTVPDAVIRLHARAEAVGFYEKNGFETVGSEFIEVGAPHIEMRLKAVYAPQCCK